MKEVQEIEKELDKVIFVFKGIEPRASYEELPPHKLEIYKRLLYLVWAHYSSLSGITKTEKEQLQILKDIVPLQIKNLKKLTEHIEQIESKLNEIQSPWTPARLIDLN